MSKKDLYTGRAGHLAVMAELLIRGWNTAIPEVDVGDDVFVVHDSDGNLHRVQVKTTATSKLLNNGRGYTSQFKVPLLQLETPKSPDITYVFAVRVYDNWDAFVVIDRETLYREHQEHGIGSKDKNSLVLRLRFEGTRIICSRHDLSQYRNDWDTLFPVIEH